VRSEEPIEESRKIGGQCCAEHLLRKRPNAILERLILLKKHIVKRGQSRATELTCEGYRAVQMARRVQLCKQGAKKIVV
jgi:hypothetical protein